MPKLSGDLIRHKLSTHIFGQNIVYQEQVGSTNTELKYLAHSGTPEGLLYITEEQITGRGRLNRSWQAPPGSSLLFSLLFRPADYIVPTQMGALTMLCSLAMVDAISTHTTLSVHVKWPNDLVGADGKKLAGILTESEFMGTQLNWVIVGIGVNINIDFNQQANSDSEPRNLAQTATSLSMLLNRNTSDLRLPILQTFLKNVEQRYIALQKGVSPHFEWQRKLIDLDKSITVTMLDKNQQHTGKIISITENGTLRLREEGGTIITILAGDATLR